MIDYRVIEKAQIPAPDQARTHNYGEWLPLARLLKRLEPHQALEIDVPEGMRAHSVFTALYSAAKGAGVRISLQYSDNRVYVVKRGTQPVYRKPIKETFMCQHCNETKPKTHHAQEWCGAEKCQRERRRLNNLAWYRENKQRGVAHDRAVEAAG